MKQKLLEKIKNKEIKVGVVGLGYVGLPLAVEKAKAGFIIGIEKILYKVLPKAFFLPIFKFAHALFLYQSEKDALKNKINKLM